MNAGGADLRQLREIIAGTLSAPSLPELHRVLLTGLAKLVPGEGYDLVLCGGGAGEEGMFHAKPDTYTADELSYMLAHADDHPAAQGYRAGLTGAFSVSQFLSDRVWRETALYHEGGYRRMGFHYEVAVDIPGIRPGSLAALSVLRTQQDFDERDREILNLLRPVITEGWRRVDARTQSSSPFLLRRLFPELSAREAEILYWITEGKLNAEIADILARRLGTIQEHVENIVRKLGVENRHQLAVAALKACFRDGVG